MNDYLQIKPEVLEALNTNKAVVALESTTYRMGLIILKT